MFCVVFVFSCISQVLEKNIQNPSSSKIRTNSSQEAEKEAIVFILFRCKIVKSRICFDFGKIRLLQNIEVGRFVLFLERSVCCRSELDKPVLFLERS